MCGSLLQQQQVQADSWDLGGVAGKLLAQTKWCCNYVEHYGLVPNKKWGCTPWDIMSTHDNQGRGPWDQKNCNTLVGEGGGKCATQGDDMCGSLLQQQQNQ